MITKVKLKQLLFEVTMKSRKSIFQTAYSIKYYFYKALS